MVNMKAWALAWLRRDEKAHGVAYERLTREEQLRIEACIRVTGEARRIAEETLKEADAKYDEENSRW